MNTKSQEYFENKNNMVYGKGICHVKWKNTLKSFLLKNMVLVQVYRLIEKNVKPQNRL